MDVLKNLLPVTEGFRAVAEATHRLDRLPREHLEQLAETGLFELSLPAEQNGLEAPLPILWEAAEVLSSACGVTHFVQAQHVSALSTMARSAHRELAESSMPAWRAGERFAGICFAHLRRPNSPVTVEDSGDAYIFRGEAPWFSGWGIFDEVMIAGRSLADANQHIYVLVSTHDPAIQASPPLELAAMNASSTVTLLLKDLRVPKDRLVMTQTAEEMNRRDFSTLLRYGAPSLGVVRSAATLLEPAYSQSFLARAAMIRTRSLDWKGDEKEAVAIRADANELALHATQAAIVASGGAANRLDHPAQRLSREASFYHLTQLTAPLREATLHRLAAG